MGILKGLPSAPNSAFNVLRSLSQDSDQDILSDENSEDDCSDVDILGDEKGYMT